MIKFFLLCVFYFEDRYYKFEDRVLFVWIFCCFINIGILCREWDVEGVVVFMIRGRKFMCDDI